MSPVNVLTSLNKMNFGKSYCEIWCCKDTQNCRFGIAGILPYRTRHIWRERRTERAKQEQMSPSAKFILIVSLVRLLLLSMNSNNKVLIVQLVITKPIVWVRVRQSNPDKIIGRFSIAINASFKFPDRNTVDGNFHVFRDLASTPQR